MKLRPNDPDVLFHKGLALGKIEKYQEAVEYMEKVIKLNPSNAEALFLKGDILFTALKQNEEALLSVSEAVRLNPKHELAQSLKRTLETLQKIKQHVKDEHKLYELH